jgi:hypothetical protein
MKHSGLTVFLIFFGIALLDAIAGGHWWQILFWVGVGVAFWGLEKTGHRFDPATKGPGPRR